MSWQLLQQERPDTNQVARWQGLLWLLQKTSAAMPELSALVPLQSEPNSANLRQSHHLSEQMANRLATRPWPETLSHEILKQLTAAQPEFQRHDVPQPILARRAEWLVVARDRLQLSVSTNNPATAVIADLDALFRSVQSLPDFDPDAFAKQLARLAGTLRR